MSDTHVSAQQLLSIIGQKQVQIEILLAENEQLHMGLDNLKRQFEELKGRKKPSKQAEAGDDGSENK